MFNALFYLQFNSVKNRLTMRFKRLKQPKYLIGLIVGGLYFYWYFSRVLFVSHSHYGTQSSAAASPVDALFYESLGALILFIVVLLAWVIPGKRASLTFTEAEVAFLFPAPVTRRTLIHFKLMKSQLGILFGALFLTLISSRFGADGRWLIRAAGWWVILFTFNLHSIAASFALTKLMDRGLSTWKRRVVVLTLVVAALSYVGLWAVREIPELTSADLTNLDTVKEYARQLLVSGPLPYLLFPFRLVVQPYLAPDWLAFLKVIWPAILLMLLHYIWVIRSDVSFEEASIEASKKQAEKIAAVRSGNWRSAGKQLKQKRAPFNLRPTGAPFMALFWKNLISTGNLISIRLVIILVIVAVAMSSGLHGSAGATNWATLIGIIAILFAAWLVMIGPQFVRQDFRQDLPQMDVLKVFPLPGWQIALGEILAPAVILTCVHWLLLLIGVLCLAPHPPIKIPGNLIVAMGFGAALIVPAINVISLLIPNAAVLLFSAWFQAGKDSPRGIEATGQRLIFAIGQFLAFAVSLIPAAAVFYGLFSLVNYLTGRLLEAFLAAAIGGAVVLAVEAGLGVMLLGYLFNRFDVSGEPTT
ncbi:MAG TPA: putative ABC exporter domain-containing protein [Verrucomicrobiae bacterium]